MPDEIMFLAEGIEAAITSTEGLEASSSASGFADHNLLDRNQNTLCKPGGTGLWTIKIDLGETRPVSAVGIINGNPKTGGNHGDNSWEYMKLYSDTQWTFATETQRLYAVPATADEPLWYEDFTEASARYWKIHVQNCLVNVTKIGAIVLGTPYKSDLPYHRPRPMRSSYGIDVRETKGGHRHSNLRFEDRKIWRRADFDVLTEEDWDDLFQYLWQASKGGHYPCLFRDVDDSLNWIRVNAGRGTLDYQESLNHFFQAPFVFEQEF